MVDATDLKSVVLLGVRVRVPPSAPFCVANAAEAALYSKRRVVGQGT